MTNETNPAAPQPTPQAAEASKEIDEVSSAPWQLLEMARRVSAAYRNDTLTIQEVHYLETMIERAEKLPTAARDVLAERRRQVSAEGWTQAHDDEHDGGELAGAAAAYAAHASDALHPLSQGDAFRDGTIPDGWCWEPAAWKPGAPRRNLVKAGALILAEIERLDRATLPTTLKADAAKGQKL